MPETSQTIPVEAARFSASPFEFAEPAEAGDAVPVRLHARDAQPIQHWWWGKIAHDMSGITLHKDRVTIDYCHHPEKILGYVDQFDADPDKGLDLSGAVLPKLDDLADQVVKKQKAGVPYESSIDWTGPAVIEYVDAGTSTDVNGYEFEGPGYIVRKWHLRGVAICPYGADMSTTTEFSADQAVGVTVFTQSDKGVVMPTQKPSTKDASQDQTGQKPETDSGDNKPAETKDSTPTPTPSTDQNRAELGKRFVDTFGEDHGPKYFAAGLSFEDALAEHSKKLTAENADLKASLDKLTKDVAGLREHAGDATGVDATAEGTTQDTETDKKASQFGSTAIAAMAAKYANASQG